MHGELHRCIGCCASSLLAPAETLEARRSALGAVLACLAEAVDAGRLLIVARQSLSLGGGPQSVVEHCAPGLAPHSAEQLFPDGMWVVLQPRIRAVLLGGEPWSGHIADLGAAGTYLHHDVVGVTIVPLSGGESFWGSLVISASDDRPWDEEALELFTIVARIVSGTIRRWESEERVRDSAAQLHAVFATLPIHFWLADGEGRLLLQSDTSASLSGSSVGSAPAYGDLPELLGDGWGERSSRVSAGEVVYDELSYTRDGATRVFDAAMLPVDEGPNAGGMVGMLVDVTARKAAEVALAASEARFRCLAEQLPAFLYCVDLQTRRVTYANQGLFLGFTLAQLGEPGQMERMVYADDVAAAEQAWEHFVAGRHDAVLTEELRLHRADGAIEWVQRRGVRMRGADGAVNQALLMCAVITPLKQAEEHRRAEERRSFEAQKLESLGVLAGGIAHDFNNLLTTILGHAELGLAEAPAGSPVASSLGQILAGARAAAAVTGQILAYTGRSPRELRSLSLADMVSDVARRLAASLPEHIALSWSRGPDLPPVEGDPAQLRQVLLNLVSNAAEATRPPGGQVRLHTASAYLDRERLSGCVLGSELAPGVYVCVEVRDCGEGIAEAAIARIFEPFYSTRFIGRGLGLAVVRGVVQAHGGAIELMSRPGAGTLVRVWLPAVRPPVALQQLPPTKGRALSGGILLVDDEERVRSVTGRMLERLGMSVFSVADGPSALAALDAGLPDLRAVLADLTMPGMGGAALARTVQRCWPHLPVVLMSGYSLSQIEQLLEGATPTGVLSKPFTLAALRSSLVRALDYGEGQSR